MKLNSNCTVKYILLKSACFEFAGSNLTLYFGKAGQEISPTQQPETLQCESKQILIANIYFPVVILTNTGMKLILKY